MSEVTVFHRIYSWFAPRDEEKRNRQTERIGDLTRALERNPESAASYVSRGEAHWEAGDTESAERDFRQALLLADAQFSTETWGVVVQAIRDRALQGLRQAQGSSSADEAGRKTGKG